jgi:hypothetical protein
VHPEQSAGYFGFIQPPEAKRGANMITSKLPFRIGTIAIVLMLALGSAQPVFAASNDNFAQAIIIGSLPYYSYDNNFGATFEEGEPSPSCGYGYSYGTIWYAYTPTKDISLIAGADYWDVPALLAIYTGSWGNLTQIFCGTYYPQYSFRAQANVTYYFQVSDLYNYRGMVPFHLEETPPPYVSIMYSPPDPSVFDNIAFSDNIYDPAGIYGGAPLWNLGDGTTSSLDSFTHQYAKDGDYSVSLSYTTSDGRTGSSNTTVQVRTRDVAVTKFTVPQTTKSNTTKELTVEVTNRRYADNVQVQLYKGLPGGGEQLIGTLTIFVPARTTRSTLFKFSYTFTGCDATVGKATFRAAATLMSGRDALPADNTAIKTTLVTGAKSQCTPTSYP